MITAEIITIGNELLSGKQTDTNSALIGMLLGEIGIEVARIISVGDKHEHMRNAILSKEMNCQLKIISGGLGPTHDDITREVLCQCFECELVMNNLVLANIENIFKVRGYEMSERNRNQAMVPSKASILMNERGTAPGIVFEHEQVLYISLPAVPFELEYLMKNKVLPLLKEKLGLLNSIHSRDFIFIGIGESFLYDILLEKSTLFKPENEFAFLPSPGIIKFRQTIREKNQEESFFLFAETERQILATAPLNYFGSDVENIALVLQNIFIRKNMTLSVAESCTGGYIGHLITSNSGSSQWFSGGVIAYSNEVKMNQLGVSSQLLKDHGAVSEEVVIAMAEGARNKLSTDYAISVSGIAGPDGGTDEKPVGTIWIAVASPDKTVAKLHNFGFSGRSVNFHRAAVAAMMMVYEMVK